MKMEEMRNYAEIFARHEANPLMKNIASGKTGFVNELEDFYGISHERIYGRGGGSCLFRLQNEESQKTGRIPKNLLEIIQDFSEQAYKEDELRYENVRTNFNPPSTKEEKQGVSIIRGSVIAAAVSLPFVYYLTGSTQVTGTVFSLTSLAGCIISMPYFYKNPRPKRIFPILFDAAEEADSFRKYYIACKIFEDCKSKNEL